MFIFLEMDDVLCDAILYFLNLAFLDDAFRIGVRSLRELYKVRVRAPKLSIHWKFKKEWLKRPFLRQPGKGSETSEESLRYFTHLLYHQRLGREVGFPKNLKPYEMRRGVGEVVAGNYLHPSII